jgi:hypothetical protein
VGVKPVFMCEYGVPFTWDWTMYRGWYKGQREFGSAKVPWEFCLAEWNSQFVGDRAFAISEAEKANLRWEAKQFKAGSTWHRWDYPNQVGSSRFDERYAIFAMYITDNWRAFRRGGPGIRPGRMSISEAKSVSSRDLKVVGASAAGSVRIMNHATSGWIWRMKSRIGWRQRRRQR